MSQREFIAYFDERHQQTTGARYAFMRGKDGRIVKDLRAVYDDEELRRLVDDFFETRDPFIQQAGYSLGIFKACLPKLILHVARQRMIHGEETPEQWVRRVGYCRHQPRCEQAGQGACLERWRAGDGR